MRKTLNQIIICALLMINTFNYNTIAQDILPTPPTPQSAQFMRYGEIPVGHTTGVPQIEIPIYTINTGIIDIPISISYHASGFKVNDVASPIGLGWVVNANGWLISRIVHGSPDHLYQNCRLDSENTIRTPEDLEKVKTGEKKIDRTDFSNPYSAEFWHTYFIKNGDWPVSDVRSDRYFYSIPWHMGTAQYSADNMDIGLQTIPYEPLVFNYNTKENYYTITDTKGIIYTFATKEHNKPDGEKPLISGWYLTSIKFPQLTEEVIFTYKEGKGFTTQNYIQTDIYYNRYDVVQHNNAVDNVDPYTPIHNVQGRGYTTKPKLLSEIKWKNTIVRFTYTTDRDDGQAERLTQINVINKIGDKEENIKQVKFNNGTYFGTKKANHRLKLSGIEFTYSGEKYSFSYDESKNSSLPAYYGYEGSPYSTEDYWGYWNGTSSSYWVFPQAVADYFNKSLEQGKKIQGVDKNPNLEYTKACVLTDIVYPTKGKTHFEYELNPGTFNSSNIKTKDGKIGGLRVTRITNYTEDGSVAGIKEYEYSGKTIYGEYNNNNFSFENLFVISKPFVDFYTMMNPAGGDARAQLVYPCTYTSSPLQCFFDASKSLIFYNKVIEYNGTKSNNNGYTIYNYTKASDRVSTNTVNYCGPHELLAFVKSVDCDFGYDRGILTLQTTYDKNGKIKHEKSISYSNYVKTLKTGVRMGLYLDVEGGNLTSIVAETTNTTARNGGLPDYANGLYGGIILDNIIAVQTYAYQTISEPTSESEKWYDENGKYITKTSTYEYHKKSDGLPTISKPTKISITNSNGLKYDEYNTYACQKATEAPYKEMISKNMHEYLIENTTNVYNTSNESIKTPYQKIGNLYLPKTLIKDNVQRVEYKNYDSHGNLNYAIKDGVQKVVTIYSYNYSYPVFVVEGVTLDQVQNILTNNGFNIEQFGAAIPTDEQIEKIRKSFGTTTKVTTYTYKLNIGITSVTDSRGYKTFYEYDTAGRLKNVWEQTDNGKKLLQNYKYNYSTK